MCFANAATIVGTFLEVAGIYMVAVELSRVEQREFGKQPPHVRLWARIRRGRRKDVTIHVPLASAVTTESAARARLTKVAGPNATLEKRVAALEDNLASVTSELDAVAAEGRDAVGKVDRRVDEVASALNREQAAREQQRKEGLRETVRWQWRGTYCFLAGACLTGLGSLF